MQMNPINRKKLKDYIDDLGSFGGTNFHAGFSKAFGVLRLSQGHK